MKENRTSASIFTRISRMVGIAFWAVLIVACISVILSEAAFMPRSRRIPFDFMEIPLI